MTKYNKPLVEFLYGLYMAGAFLEEIASEFGLYSLRCSKLDGII